MASSAGAPPYGAASLKDMKDMKDMKDWLGTLQLQRFFPALTEEGVEDMAFLRSMDDDEARELCEDVGMKRMQQKRFMKAVRNLRTVAVEDLSRDPDPAPAALEEVVLKEPKEGVAGQTDVEACAESLHDLLSNQPCGLDGPNRDFGKIIWLCTNFAPVFFGVGGDSPPTPTPILGDLW